MNQPISTQVELLQRIAWTIAQNLSRDATRLLAQTSWALNHQAALAAKHPALQMLDIEPWKTVIVIRYPEKNLLCHAANFKQLKELAAAVRDAAGITEILICGSDVSWHVSWNGVCWIQESINLGGMS